MWSVCWKCWAKFGQKRGWYRAQLLISGSSKSSDVLNIKSAFLNMDVPQSIRSSIFTPPPNTETTFYGGASHRFLFFCTPRSTCSNNLIRHARGRVFENSKCSGGKKEEGRHLWETEVPLMGKGVLGGATYQLHKCLTNISFPPHIFSQISTQES